MLKMMKKKKNENKQCEISATKDKPIQKELHEADTTKNKEFAKKQMILKMVDDRKTIFVLYILTHMKTRSFMIVVLTLVAVLSMKEQVVNVPEP